MENQIVVRSEFELSIHYLGRQIIFYAFRNICLH